MIMSQASGKSIVILLATLTEPGGNTILKVKLANALISLLVAASD